jgi:hypothetical protein
MRGARFAGAAFGLVALAAVGTTTGCGGPARARDLVTIETAPSDDDFTNPERGFFTSVDLLGEADLSRASASGTTLVHAPIRLDRFRDGPLPQALLDALETGFARVRRAGLKVIPRFMYNAGPYPRSQPDASEATIEAHIAQLAPILAANADVIAALEAGFVGAWGEWHSSSHRIDADRGAKQRILAALLGALPADRMVSLRFPSDVIALVGKLPPARAGSSDPTARVGSHLDCFLGSDDDVGTWGRSGHSADDE